jgi:hypothetical protein
VVYRQLSPSRNLLAYSVMVGGVLLDQLTTRYGLYIGYYEANPVALWLMGEGLWFTVDIMLLVSIIGLTMYISEKLEFASKMAFFYPFLLGSLRIYAGIRNLGLII